MPYLHRLWCLRFFVAIGLFLHSGLATAQEVPSSVADQKTAGSLEARKREAAELFDAILSAHEALPAYSATFKIKTNILSQPDTTVTVRVADGRRLMQVETGEGVSYGAYADERYVLYSTKDKATY